MHYVILIGLEENFVLYGIKEEYQILEKPVVGIYLHNF